MKKTVLSVLATAALFGVFAFSQQPKAATAKHKVVFELNAPSPSGWDQIFNNVNNIQQIFKDDGVQVEIVFFGKGLPMLLKTNAAYAERLKQAADNGVILAACQNSMRAQKVKSEDIFPFSTEVDSGVAELVRKQEAGWVYIKGGE
jgi:intracellular sulfur oxidation DsrE/DsrF family protein